MIPHPPALDAAYGSQAWEPLLRATFVDPQGRPLSGLAAAAPAGRYVCDASRWPRTDVELTLPTSLTPDRTAPPVSPYGGSLWLDVGARFLGSESWFRLATLDVVETVVDRPAGTISVRAASHEARVDEDRIETRTATSSGTGTALVISLVRRTLGASHPVRNLVTSDPSYAAGAFPLDGGVWDTVEKIADASGFEAWFDAQGSLVLAPPAVKGTPVVAYTVGDGGTVTGYRSGRGWAYNRVAVVYDDGTSRRVGLWEDTLATSQTKVSGPYGRHTRIDNVTVDAGKLPTQLVADRAAANIGRRAAAPYRSVELSTIPAPWVEPGDTIAVDFLGNLTETLLVGRHEFPLDALDVATVTAVDDSYTATGG